MNRCGIHVHFFEVLHSVICIRDPSTLMHTDMLLLRIVIFHIVILHMLTCLLLHSNMDSFVSLAPNQCKGHPLTRFVHLAGSNYIQNQRPRAPAVVVDCVWRVALLASNGSHVFMLFHGTAPTEVEQESTSW